MNGLPTVPGSVRRFEERRAYEHDLMSLASVGYDVYRFDCALWPDEESMHAELMTRLSFPDYYGRNLDALSECLCDMEATGGAGRVLAFVNWGALQGTKPQRAREKPLGEILLSILEHAAWFQAAYKQTLISVILE